MLYRGFLAVLVAVLVATLVALPAAAQSLTSGDVAGVVTDSTGAAVSNAAVTLKNNDTGSSQVRNTSSQGAFRFQLLQPGTYTVSVAAPTRVPFSPYSLARPGPPVWLSSERAGGGSGVWGVAFSPPCV